MPNSSFGAVAPRFVSEFEAIQIIGSRKLVERMLQASRSPKVKSTWLKIVLPQPGTLRRDSLIDVASIQQACDRLLAAEQSHKWLGRVTTNENPKL